MSKVALYIAHHNKIDIKYFGKSSKYLTEEELQKYYHGSGKLWNNILNKYGDDVRMELFGVFDESEVEEIALKFSKDNDIVNSKKWANLMYEDGKQGWPSGSNNPAYYMSDFTKFKIAETMRRKISEKEITSPDFSGEKNPMYGKNYQSYGLKKYTQSCKGKTWIEIHGEYKAEMMRLKQSLTRLNIHPNWKEVKCPFCCLVGIGPNMSRYHFDNCYLNTENPNNKIGYSEELLDYRSKEYKCKYCCKTVENIRNLNRWHNDNCELMKNIGIFEYLVCPICDKRLLNTNNPKSRGSFKRHIKKCMEKIK
jgi:hypothetical protein